MGKEVGEPGFGWRYVSDAREGRAVVISPTADFDDSNVEGVKLVFNATIAA
jgi:hypothetical protein